MHYGMESLIQNKDEEEKISLPCGVRGSPARAMCCSIVLLLSITISLSVVLALQIRINTIMSSQGLDYDGSKHIGIISDIHLDLDQNTTACRRSKPWNVTATHYPTQFGVRGCDPSLAFVNLSIEALNKKLLDAGSAQFSLLLGDIVGHFTEGWEATLKTVSVVCQLLLQHTSVPVFITLGNNDVPFDYTVPDNNTQEWYSAVWERFYPLLNRDDVDMRDANSTFVNGGYYCVMKDSLYIVSLHTNAFSVRSNIDSDTAYRQLAWLNEVLIEAKVTNNSVMIIGHIPQGFALYVMEKSRTTRDMMWRDEYTTLYSKICTKHADVISATYFGHHHADSWFVTQTDQGRVSSFNIPSISQIYEGEPTFTLSVLNDNWRVLDLLYYYCPLDFYTRGDTTPHYLLQYSFKYRMLMNAKIGASKWTPITSLVLKNLVNKLLDFDDLMYTFNERMINQHQYSNIPFVSPYQMYCQMTEIMIDGLEACLKKYQYSDFFPAKT